MTAPRLTGCGTALVTPFNADGSLDDGALRALVEPEGTVFSKPITVTAQNPGCYKYDAGAFYSGAVYGMGAGSRPELVILP